MQKNVLLPQQIATSQSLAASFNSSPTMISYTDNIAYQINVTTSNSVGTFAVQASQDYVPANSAAGGANAGNWATLTLSGTPAVAGANDTIVIDLKELPYNAIRLAYTASTPGTGTCNIIVVS
jgi:hypothetical protein